MPGLERYCSICGDPTHSTQRHEETLDELFAPDYGLIKTVVEPLFGSPFVVMDYYDPTLKERLFGRRRKEKPCTYIENQIE